MISKRLDDLEKAVTPQDREIIPVEIWVIDSKGERTLCCTLPTEGMDLDKYMDWVNSRMHLGGLGR